MILNLGQRWRYRTHDGQIEYILEIIVDRISGSVLNSGQVMGGKIIQVIANQCLKIDTKVGFGSNPKKPYCHGDMVTDTIKNSWGEWTYLPGQDVPIKE